MNSVKPMCYGELRPGDMLVLTMPHSARREVCLVLAARHKAASNTNNYVEIIWLQIFSGQVSVSQDWLLYYDDWRVKTENWLIIKVER